MPEPLTTTSYDANNRQLTFGDKTLAYDDNGNLQSITDSNGTTLYQWNARNQLVGISGPTVNANFVYDGVGRREKRTINGSVTEFLYDGINPVQESSGANILANILPGLGIDEFLTRTDVIGGVTSNFLADALGSAVAVTDNAGAVQTDYIYEAFGRTTTTGTSNSSAYQFTGRENDGTGLYYYRARYYHPTLQRFIREDPIEFRGGDINLYAYVGNNPVIDIDPFGLETYMCRQPLHALGGTGLKSGPDIWANPLYHQFLCVKSGGTTVCGGQDRQGGPWSDGKPSEDRYSQNNCKPVEPDNNCLERCLKEEFGKPRPWYGLTGPGTNCQEWSNDVLSRCRQRCKK